MRAKTLDFLLKKFLNSYTGQKQVSITVMGQVLSHICLYKVDFA